MTLSLLVWWACASAPAPEAPTVAPADQSDGPTSGEVLARMDGEIRAAERRAAQHPGDWLRWEEVALGWAARARWTGDYADWGRAEDALAVAFAIAPERSGPLLSRAGLHFALHRLDRAEADLAVVQTHLLLDDPKRSEILRMQADIALQRGQVEVAAEGYARSLELHPTLAGRFGLAQVASWRGEYDQALVELEACEELLRGERPETRMWLDLQRGLVELARGRNEEALAHYRAADAHVFGHWLVREHIAEVTALLGRAEEAVALYEEIVLDTHHPEFMDALGALLEARGDEAAAREWYAWAEAGFERRLRAYPEAAAGHALDHYLRGGDPQRAVELAERNAHTRPNGEALTALATAYRQAGRLDEARATVDRAVATGWVSAELDAERELAGR